MTSKSDLIATQKITQFIESAKAHGDRMLDELPLAYGVVQDDGRVLRGNSMFAALLGETDQTLLGQNLERAFSESGWTKFKDTLGTTSSFELPIMRSGSERDYLWHVRPLKYSQESVRPLFVVMGQDISEVKTLSQKNGRMESELVLAQTVQASLFPAMNMQILGVDVAAYYSPASECSGDWFYFHEIGGKVFCWIVDVTGHGAPAALITSAIRGALSVLEQDHTLTPLRAIRALNHVVSTSSEHKYASAFVCSIEPETGFMNYSFAAHNHARVFVGSPEGSSSVHELVTKPSSQLGQPGAVFYEQTYEMRPGDTVMLYTDGLVELVNPSKVQWRTRKLMQAATESMTASSKLQDRIDHVINAANTFRQGVPPDDDISLVMIRWKS